MDFKYESDPAYQAILQNNTEQFTFFWGGEFSQWKASPIRVDGFLFPTSEHYMMWHKAMLFDDRQTADKILLTKSARDVKAFGRQITPFDEKKWNDNKVEIVYRGSMHKFVQHPDLMEILFDTQGTTLVEASPEDPIWGIGLLESDMFAKQRSTWKGENLLGRVLTQVRYELLLNTY